MLTIIYGDESNCVYNTNVYFKNTYEPEWFETELAKQIVREVDDSEVLSSECIQSPVLGQIPPERLSGGVKTLLLILKNRFLMLLHVVIIVQNGFWKLENEKM